MRLIPLLLLLAFTGTALAQNKTLRLLDSQTGEPVPYATVATGPGKGTISNEEGFFTVSTGALAGAELRISCMGYRTLELNRDALLAQSGPIRLEPAAINLNEVRLTNRVPGVEEILREVRQRLEQNYANIGKAYGIFYRESEYMQFDDLQLELEKASDLNRRALAAADARLRKLGQDIARSDARKFLDFKGGFTAVNDTALVLRVDRATELTDHKQGYSMDEIQERAQEIILSHLDSSRTYKVKTGIFKIEDSISPGKEFADEAERENDSTDFSYLKGKSKNLAKTASWKDGTLLRELIDPDMYRHSFLKATYFDGNYVYAIGFEPRKRKASYAGTLYVDAASFAVLKADYAYGKGRRGDKVNLKLLLGIKYVENLSRGTVIFRRNDLNTYDPYFIQSEYGNYIYLHRSLKFIENSPQKKKVRFDFLMEGGVRQRESVLLSPLAPDAARELAAYREPKKILIQEIDRYEPTIWEDTQIIEPLEEMKNFRVRGD
ncbi:carboxypeptidase-like regulatory domain-containing protein [Robiginitalea sp. SC105]|uniref:carboxypeptidase-like regulatory domain-containing protein n=1 Tax=Robiginitalea sp. SC105 TaxID=2762332 RepID=UPI00163A7AE2|nr:carboxypeptidase-like regulatory domain-containing protein [Robiginitalea sp. SC105]MBC2840637.1 carboxypeptidase-like regulatory domain-containing protein [Robiginitalea sp. SC105]